jgi:hypothetical protein
MTAQIVPASEVERHRYQRACRKAAYKGEGVDQGSHFDRLQRQFAQASVSRDDTVCEFCAPEGAFCGYLPQLPADTRQGVGRIRLAWATAIARAGMNWSQRLLHHCQSVSSSSLTMELGRAKFPAAVTENVPGTEARRDP